MAVTKVVFETSAFILAHGRSPRGRGSWGFCPSSVYDRANYLESVFWFTGLFTEARAAARTHFAAKGVRRVTVCS